MGPALLARFERFSTDPGASELDAALLVNALLEDGLDTARLEREVRALAGRGDRRLPPWEFLAREGFHGDRADFGALDDSRLDRVLERRRGLPITLGVLLITVAREHGRRAAGINFPGHFLVRVDDALIDPFELRVTREASWLGRLPEGLRGAEAFAVASPTAVLQRMLNNVKQRHRLDRCWHLALDVLDCQRAMLPGSAGLAFERGEIWLELGAVEAAKSAFEEARRHSAITDPALAKSAAARLAALAQARGTLH